MISITRSNIFTADLEAIVNPVNCIGVMGKGLALQFRKAYPRNYHAYADACKAKVVKPGQMFIYPTGQLSNPRYIINFPTKRHWRDPSLIEDIEAGLIALVEDVQRLGIRSIGIPPLGAGLGGLEWALVKEKITTAMQPLSEVDIWLYEPI